jgi:hypothetical protein
VQRSGQNDKGRIDDPATNPMDSTVLGSGDGTRTYGILLGNANSALSALPVTIQERRLTREKTDKLSILLPPHCSRSPPTTIVIRSTRVCHIAFDQVVNTDTDCWEKYFTSGAST